MKTELLPSQIEFVTMTAAQKVAELRTLGCVIRGRDSHRAQICVRAAADKLRAINLKDEAQQLEGCCDAGVAAEIVWTVADKIESK